MWSSRKAPTFSSLRIRVEKFVMVLSGEKERLLHALSQTDGCHPTFVLAMIRLVTIFRRYDVCLKRSTVAAD